MPDFVEVASIEHVIPGTGALVRVSATDVALFNVNNRIFAMDDVCIRCAASLAAGALHATLIRCAGCGWQFDVVTGCVDGVPALRAQTFDVRIENVAILVSSTAKQLF